jgi:ectoine hydroxylase-related dioxygenase (phytanoyl-CoA dioxygenase family)
MSMGIAVAHSYRLDPAERARLERDGYVVRERVFNASECAAIATDCENLAAELLAAKRSTKHVVGSYMFERQEAFGINVKWEPASPDLVMGIEPFAHHSEPLNALGHDPRLIDPCKDLIGEEHIVLFTEKINFKRARDGGPIILHQDYPYWAAFTDIASRVGTAMVFLDDANVRNGCLEVAPGTHREGVQKRWETTGLRNREMDDTAFDVKRLVPLEVPAGSVAYFNSFLVHRSLPNRSAHDRRALLYSYQPAGNPHAREIPRPFKLTDG